VCHSLAVCFAAPGIYNLNRFRVGVSLPGQSESMVFFLQAPHFITVTQLSAQ